MKCLMPFLSSSPDCLLDFMFGFAVFVLVLFFYCRLLSIFKGDFYWNKSIKSNEILSMEVSFQFSICQEMKIKWGKAKIHERIHLRNGWKTFALHLDENLLNINERLLGSVWLKVSTELPLKWRWNIYFYFFTIFCN